MVVLCLGLCAAQRQGISAPQNLTQAAPTQATESPQGAATTTTPPAIQVAPTAPTPSAANAASGLQLSSGLNSLQGLKVAMIQINGPGVDDGESLLPILRAVQHRPVRGDTG